MNTLITYATNHGCTEKCAGILAKKLTGKVDLCNLKEAKNPDISSYDAIVIGGSIYAGQIQKVVREFCTKNLAGLKDKKVGLFICCMMEGDAAGKEIETSFPQELLAHAAAKAYFGGELIMKKMNFLERFIIKAVAKTDKDMSAISEKTIHDFAETMSKA